MDHDLTDMQRGAKQMPANVQAILDWWWWWVLSNNPPQCGSVLLFQL
jgi:hypothetical protein